MFSQVAVPGFIINFTGSDGNENAVVEIDVQGGQPYKLGLLIPRVVLDSARDQQFGAVFTDSLPASLIVYNTGSAKLPAGIYYWDTTVTPRRWVRLLAVDSLGSPGQVLTSQGPNNPPQWSTLSVGGGGFSGCSPCPSMWSNYSSSSMTWGACARYCANLVEGGYSDWRMPTLYEAIELATKVNAGTNTNPFWTATPGGNAGYYYIWTPADGFWDLWSAGNNSYCRCVR